MIRVLQVFGRTDRGGSETMIMNIFRNLDRTKVQFDFVVHTQDKCAFDDEIMELGGRIFPVPRLNLKNVLIYKKAWKELLIAHPEWKIVHSHIMSSAATQLRIAKKLSRVTISHSHSVSAGTGKKAILKRILENGIKADYYFACSKAAGIFLYGENIISNPSFKVLPNAINTKEYEFNTIIRDKVRNDLEISDDILFGHVGNFTEVKNHHFLLDIFSVIKKKKERSKLMLVGDGPLRNEIEEYARHLGLENDIIFTGVRSDVNELVQAMDFFVFPSLFEGLPVTIVEAQTSGLPCVISDTVPDECILTSDLVSVMSLQQSAEEWANHILSRLGKPRVSHAEEVRAHGYDIAESLSKWLEEFYLSKANETR